MNFLTRVLFFGVIAFGANTASAKDFFTIERIDHLKREPRDKDGAYQEIEKVENKKRTTLKKFVPCLTVRIRTDEQIRSSGMVCKAYFYDRDNKLLASLYEPTPKISGGRMPSFPMPFFFKKNDPTDLYFAVPENLQKRNDWKVLVVIGDKYEAGARIWPDDGSPNFLEFPEKELVRNPKERPEYKAEMDPLIEYVVKTNNDKQPQITLFVRPPVGMTDASEAQGVLAMCLLANGIESIRRKLQGLESGEEVGGLIQFAQEHKLIILCWGSRSLWNPGKNWDEQSKEVTRAMDENLDEVAKAWAKGIEELHKKYGIPDHNFLLRGTSGSAQYALRLALRQPQYFLAVHAHIPSSFDKPTLEGNRVLWCLTTGELESGYERSKRYYTQCRELGYPMIYKAIVGLGHQGHPNAENLGRIFFEYALSVKDQREAYETSLRDAFGNYKPLLQLHEGAALQPWPEAFRTPAFVGDIVNQEMYPFAQQNMVPVGFRVLLPTKELAEAWDRK